MLGDKAATEVKTPELLTKTEAFNYLEFKIYRSKDEALLLELENDILISIPQAKMKDVYFLAQEI
jgi:hypothetical protein